MAITNMNELAKAVGASQDIPEMAGARNLLRKEANRLLKLLQKYIDEYYASYQPKVYERTYFFKYSLRYEDVQQIGNTLSIVIFFDEGFSTHESILGGKDGFVPILLNDGYRTRLQPPRYHFTHYEGFHFVEKAIEEYNRVNPLGVRITVDVVYSGTTIRHVTY